MAKKKAMGLPVSPAPRPCHLPSFSGTLFVPNWVGLLSESVLQAVVSSLDSQAQLQGQREQESTPTAAVVCSRNEARPGWG
jgi:hypothetical protein